ncbi:MAG TPA: hypothetical protein DCZ95_17745 [Verrucomicrobia bacterium]|nr:MAG: hypothetical protein A2X46_07425 [Lentisphaerae bacterium GWF2_57_35]HBA85930.1 hypothetical protein [Verrucomicrobiota bacterium]
MKAEDLSKAVSLAQKGYLLVATADAEGLPHIAMARTAVQVGEDRLLITEWFCPGTISNVQTNKRISIVAWDSREDHGLQLIGEVDRIEELAIMNGYSPKLEWLDPVPQVERQLQVRISKTYRFCAAPHSDIEE